VVSFSALVLLAAGVVNTAKANTYTTTQNGNWSVNSTWGGSGHPVAGDTANIAGGFTVTVDTGGAACAALNIGANNQTDGLTFGSSSGSSTLAVSGNVTCSGNAGTTINITMSGGTLNIGGTLTTSHLTFSAGTGTVNYNGTAQSVAALTYNNLTLSGSGAKTTTGATVDGILLMAGTATTTGTVATYGSAATLEYNGSGAQTTGTEFPATWAGSGGVIIANAAGAVTLGAAKTINAPLTINPSATLNTSAANHYAVTFGGNFVNNGTFTANGSAITISGTGTQTIAGFTTTGTVFMMKTGGTATFTGNVNGGGLTINGSGGTLDLGTSLTHTFTGTWLRTGGTLLGDTSTLNLGSSVSGTGGTFTAGTGTVDYDASGAQTIAAVAYDNLVFSGSGAKSIATGTSVSGNLSIAPSGTATAKVGTGLDIAVGSLTLGGLGRISGTWGSTTATLATYKNNTYFAATTGYLTVSTDTRSTPTITTLPTASAITYGAALSASTLSGGSASVGGSFAFTTPSTLPTSANTYSAPVTFTPTDTTSYNTASGNVNVTVNPKALTMSGLTVPSSKVYDGTSAAVVSGSPGSLQSSETLGTGSTSDGKPYTGDAVSLTGTATGTYNSKDVATAATVAFGGVSLNGAQAGNYTLTVQSAASATITAKALTAQGTLTAPTKVYNGTTAATPGGAAALQTAESAGSGATSDGKPYSGDTVSLTGTASYTYTSKDVGATVVNESGLSLTGAQAGDYSLTAPSLSGASITVKTLFVSGLSASGKTYDATTVATLSGTAALLTAETGGSGSTSDGKPYSGDTLTLGGSASGTFASKDAANGIAVTVSGNSLSGAQSGDYVLAADEQAGLTANITAKALTMSGLSVPATKVYDGTTTATVSGTPALGTAEAPTFGTGGDGKPYAGDTVSLSGTATGTCNSKDVASAATVSFGGLSLGGAQAGDYTLTTQSAASATITKKALNYTGISAASKVYNGNTTATLSGTAAALTAEAPGSGSASDGKPYTGDTVSFATATLTGTVASANAANGVAVTVTGGVTLTGAQSGDYSVGSPNTPLTANITLRTASFARNRNVPLRIAISDLFTAATDNNGGGLTLAGVTTPSTGGGATLQFNATFILYTPTTVGNHSDSFTYSVNPGGGSGTVNVTIAADPAGTNYNFVSYTVVDNHPSLTFAGVPGYSYVIQGTGSLSGTPTWTNVTTITAPSDGLFTYTDPGVTLPATVFYRAINQ